MASGFLPKPAIACVKRLDMTGKHLDARSIWHGLRGDPHAARGGRAAALQAARRSCIAIFAGPRSWAWASRTSSVEHDSSTAGSPSSTRKLPGRDRAARAGPSLRPADLRDAYRRGAMKCRGRWASSSALVGDQASRSAGRWMPRSRRPPTGSARPNSSSSRSRWRSSARPAATLPRRYRQPRQRAAHARADEAEDQGDVVGVQGLGAGSSASLPFIVFGLIYVHQCGSYMGQTFFKDPRLDDRRAHRRR